MVQSKSSLAFWLQMGCVFSASIASPVWAQSLAGHEYPPQDRPVPTRAVEGTVGTDGAGDRDQASTVGEVIVTALKHATTLQQTPLAVTALTGTALSQANITDFDELTKAVPGLVVTDAGPGQRRITVRGIRSAGDAQVGVYYDEAPITSPPGTTSDPGANQSDLKLFDVDRVEVLRGPQGTLYGAGAMAGAVRVIFNKPAFAYEAAVDLSAGGVEHGGLSYNLNAAVNVPLITDQLAARFVYYRDHNDGWIDNPGLHLQHVNFEDDEGGRFLVRVKPAEFLTIDAGAYYQDQKGGPTAWAPSLGRYQSPDKVVLGFEDRNRLYNVTANAELGPVGLVYTGSYQTRDFLMTRDPTYLFNIVGAKAFTPALYYQPQSVNDATNEIRLQSTTWGVLQWTLGGFFENRRSRVLSEAHVTGADGYDLPTPDIVLQRQIGDKLEQQAAFGEAAYKITPKLTLTGGFRFYNYDHTVSGVTTIGFAPLKTAASPYQQWATNYSGWLWKANASYQATPNNLVYFQAATGFRPGGVNQAIGLATALPYLPDSLTTYEIGWKASLLQDRLTLDLAGYRTDWENMQVTLNSGTFAYIGNAGSARVQGLEAEVVALPVRGLRLSANGAALSARLTSDQVTTSTVVSGSTGRSGDRIPNVPDVTATVAAEYAWDLPRELTGVARTDAVYVGRSYSDFRSTSSTYHPVGDYVTVNGRIGVRNARWGLYIFGNNLLNATAIVSAGNVLGGTIETVTAVPPRTIGVNLTANY
jgi:outer membrane receptor protein involved in Fe transport